MELSKQLGTRHRAGVGISEVSDSLTIIVSEETGHVSVAREGELLRNVDSAQLRRELEKAQNKKVVGNNKLRHILKMCIRDRRRGAAHQACDRAEPPRYGKNHLYSG